MSSATTIAATRERPLVTLDERSHVYTYRDGFHPPSVTSILGSVPPWKGRFDLVDSGILEYKREIGSQVHRATHYFDEGTLDRSSVDAVLEPYLHAWERFRIEKRFEPTQMETPVLHAAYGYAGTLDRIGRADTGHGVGLVLLDIKTGDGSMAGPQTAAYLEAWRDMILGGCTPLLPAAAAEPHDRWTVQLKADGRYTITAHCSRRDIRVFLAALELFSFNRSLKS